MNRQAPQNGIDVFSHDRHVIYHGDALKVLASDFIPNASVDLVFADPPYNIGKAFNSFRDRWPSQEEYLEWVTTWLDLCISKLKPNASLYLMCSTQCFAPIDLILRDRMTIMSRIVWHYDSSGVQATNYYGSLWEPIFHCVMDPQHYTFNSEAILVEAKTGAQRKLIDYRKPIPTPYSTTKVPGNAWYFPRVRYRMPEYENHPSQKPLALLERIIASSSNQGDLVLDPFAGAFTSAHAAANLARRSISIESDDQYVSIGLRRLGMTDDYPEHTLPKTTKTYRRRQSNLNHLRLFDR